MVRTGAADGSRSVAVAQAMRPQATPYTQGGLSVHRARRRSGGD